jgi:hypothetical protein
MDTSSVGKSWAKKAGPFLSVWCTLNWLGQAFGAALPDAFTATSDLQSFYNVCASSGASSRSSNVAHLNALLVRLKGVGAEIQSPKARQDEWSYQTALKVRAVGWMNAWAAFGILATDKELSAGDRSSLFVFSGDKESSFDLLIEAYGQMRHDEGNDPEPLRAVLKDGSPIDMSHGWYKPWQTTDGAAISSLTYHVPATADLVGVASGNDNDSTNGSERLASLWDVINTQLDTWHATNFDPSSPMPDPLNLGDLVGWLGHVSEDDGLDGFDGLEKGDLGSYVRDCVSRIQEFLDFRQKHASPEKLSELVNRIWHDRLSGANTDPKMNLGPLISAATPLPSNGEVLHDAEIWLWSVMLLSYQHDGPEAVDRSGTPPQDQDAEGSLGSIWKQFKLPPGAFSPQVSTDTNAGPPSFSHFLRWNVWPGKGTYSEVLGRLSHAGYEYLQIQRDVRVLEQTRYASLSSEQSAVAYQQDVAKIADRFGAVLQRLNLYFEQTPEQVANVTAQPMALLPLGRLREAFIHSATVSEQGLTVSDLSALVRSLRSAEEQERWINEAYKNGRQNNRDLTRAALRALAGMQGFSNWNIYALPSRTFKQYRVDLEDAAKNLREGVEKAKKAQAAVDQFKEAQRSCEKATLEVLVAHLGREMADKTIDISKLYSKVADLDTQIEQLGLKAVQFQKEALEANVQVRTQALALATQMRDLAAARVEALQDAAEETVNMVDSATAQLKEHEADLKTLAARMRQQHDDAESSSIFGVIKAVVSVAGAALAPFTGGASLAVSSMVLKGADIYHTASKVNWTNPTEALEAAGQISTDAGQAVGAGINQWGSADTKKAFADFESHIRQDVSGVKELGQDGKKVLTLISAIQDKNYAAAIAIAATNGFPLSGNIDNNGTLSLKMGPRTIELANSKLVKSLADLIQAGGMIVNDTEARAKSYANLAQLKGQELRTGLLDAINGNVIAFPQDVANALGISNSQKLEEAKTELSDALRSLEDEEAQRLAAALGEGMIVVQVAQGKVVAKGRDVAGELKGFQDRLVRYRDSQAVRALSEIQEKINGILKQVAQDAQPFIQGTDFNGLANFADHQMSDYITRVQTQLSDAKQKVSDAQDELTDTQAQKEIADSDLRGAQKFAAAASLSVDQAVLRNQRASETQQIAALESERARFGTEQQAKLEEAEALGLKIANGRLQQAYQQCLDCGINPLGKLIPGPEDASVSIRSVLTYSATPADLYDEIQLNRMAGDLVGMIQWCSMLKVPLKIPPSGNEVKPEEAYTRVVVEASKARSNIALFIDQNKDAKKGGLLQFSSDWNQNFHDKAKDCARLDWGGGFVRSSSIRWFPLKDFVDAQSMTESEKNRWLQLLPKEDSAPDVDRFLGVFRFRFQTEDTQPSPAERLESVPYTAPSGSSHDYYAIAGNMLLHVLPRPETFGYNLHNLQFQVVPPASARANTQQLVGTVDTSGFGAPFHSVQRTELDLDLQGRKREIGNQIFGDSFFDLQLTGAVGDWTIFLWGAATPSPDYKKQMMSELNLELAMPYLDVRPGTPSL